MEQEGVDTRGWAGRWISFELVEHPQCETLVNTVVGKRVAL